MAKDARSDLFGEGVLAKQASSHIKSTRTHFALGPHPNSPER